MEKPSAAAGDEVTSTTGIAETHQQSGGLTATVKVSELCSRLSLDSEDLHMSLVLTICCHLTTMSKQQCLLLRSFRGNHPQGRLLGTRESTDRSLTTGFSSCLWFI